MCSEVEYATFFEHTHWAKPFSLPLPLKKSESVISLSLSLSLLHFDLGSELFISLLPLFGRNQFVSHSVCECWFSIGKVFGKPFHFFRSWAQVETWLHNGEPVCVCLIDSTGRVGIQSNCLPGLFQLAVLQNLTLAQSNLKPVNQTGLLFRTVREGLRVEETVKSKRQAVSQIRSHKWECRTDRHCTHLSLSKHLSPTAISLSYAPPLVALSLPLLPRSTYRPTVPSVAGLHRRSSHCFPVPVCLFRSLALSLP